MSKHPENKLTSSFKEGQLTNIAKQLQWRDWTAALLKQRIGELQGKGDLDEMIKEFLDKMMREEGS